MTPVPHQVRYVGPSGQVNDLLGGTLEDGRLYDVDKQTHDELIAHPAGWFTPAGGKAKAKKSKTAKALAKHTVVVDEPDPTKNLEPEPPAPVTPDQTPDPKE